QQPSATRSLPRQATGGVRDPVRVERPDQPGCLTPTTSLYRTRGGSLDHWRAAMSFTDAELAYLATQHLGRLATAQPDGPLQVNPVGSRYNASTKTIDVAGYRMSASRKFRNVADNGRVAFVVDDIASVQPWRVRFLEIRGTAEAIDAPAD